MKVIYLSHLQNMQLIQDTDGDSEIAATPSALTHLTIAVESNNHHISNQIWIMGADAYDKLKANIQFADFIDPTTSLEDIKQGYHGNLLGRKLHVSPAVRPRLIALCVLHTSREGNTEILGFAGASVKD